MSNEAIELLRYMTEVESEPCFLDHHGYCQDHPGGFRTVGDDLTPECWVRAARRVVRDADAAEDRIVQAAAGFRARHREGPKA